MPYLQKKELKVELQKGGVCVIPSNKDQWGLPVHEMALSGYPLIVSSAVGSASEFLISGLNGFKFKKGNVQSLYTALTKITSLSDEELNNFGIQSEMLGARINSNFSAASFLSVMEFD
jgi:glycosyltransferase involved in cell wall biosynthesis